MDAGIVIVSFVLSYFAARGFGLPGPGSWAMGCSFLVASWRLQRAGLGWRDVGLRRPGHVGIALAWVAGLYLASAVLKLLVVDPLATAAGWPAMNLSPFAHLPGNAAVLARSLLLAWVSAALGEELVFRGFLLTRLEKLFGGGGIATAMAVMGQALLFGAAHWPLGLRAVTTAGLIGVLYGTAYRYNGRNLVPLMVAHGLTDTLSLVAIYAGLVPIT
jgi:membrane protease YdiL (CAAX protease family)